MQRNPRGATRRADSTELPINGQRLAWGGATLLVLVLLLRLFTNGSDGEDGSKQSTLADPLLTATTQIAWDAVTEGQIQSIETTPLTWNDVTVRSGDNLSLIFNRAGFSDRDVFDVTSGVQGQALRRIFPGQLIGFAANEAAELIAVRHIESPLKQTVYSKNEGQFVSEVIVRETETRER